MGLFKGVAVCAAFLVTAGCQGFPFDMGIMDRADSVRPDMTSYFAQRIQDGRRHLHAQRPGAAITAFRQASYHPDFAGDAYNGMAIAYDRLGRYDLAERFFMQAVEVSPADERYARNAARFGNTMLARREVNEAVRLAQGETEDTQTSKVNSQLEDIASALDADIGPTPQDRMTRSSIREVHIASREDWTKRAMADQAPRPAVMHIEGRQAADTRLAATAPQYPVTMKLASIPFAQADASSQSRFANANGNANIRVTGQLILREQRTYPISVSLAPAS